MFDKIKEWEHRYRVSCDAAFSMYLGAIDAECNAVCEAMFEETPAVKTLAMLVKQLNSLHERLRGARDALSYLPMEEQQQTWKNESRMRDSWFRYIHLRDDLMRQEMRELGLIA